MQGCAKLNERGPALRLRPDMASTRGLVLAFVRQYVGEWGQGPSFGEIANGLGLSYPRVRRAVKRLTAQGHLVRMPGPRGLALPDDIAAAARTLRAAGWAVDERGTKTALPVLPVLDYLPLDKGTGGATNGQGSNKD